MNNNAKYKEGDYVYIISGSCIDPPSERYIKKINIYRIDYYKETNEYRYNPCGMYAGIPEECLYSSYEYAQKELDKLIREYIPKELRQQEKNKLSKEDKKYSKQLFKFLKKEHFYKNKTKKSIKYIKKDIERRAKLAKKAHYYSSDEIKEMYK